MSKLQYFKNWWNSKYYIRRTTVHEGYYHRVDFFIILSALGTILIWFGIFSEDLFIFSNEFCQLLDILFFIGAILAFSGIVLVMTVTGHTIDRFETRCETKEELYPVGEE